MKAIVYCSNTGSSREYADMISNKTGIPAIDIKEAKKTLSKTDDVIFIGWIMASQIAKYKLAKELFNVKAVCACGLAGPQDKTVTDLPTINGLGDTPFFYLQGNFDLNKLKGFYKFMMKMMMNMSLKSDDPKQKEFGEILKNGGRFVSENNITPIVEYIQK